MKQSIETITPDMAKRLLEKNDGNRPVNDKRVKQFADAIINGEWQLNGESISIAKDGTLKDGQHRLRAIILANKPIKTAVNRDVDNSVCIYDRGRLRTTSDVLIMNGGDENLCKALNVAVIKLHLYIQRHKTYISDFEIKKLLEKYKDNLLFLNSIKTRKNAINAKNATTLLGCLYALESGVNKETVEKFLKVFGSGFVDSVSQQAAIVLRNDCLKKDIVIGGGAMDRLHACYATEKAIDDFDRGYVRKQSYKNTSKPTYSNNVKFKND